jgi:hypothetical protein
LGSCQVDCLNISHVFVVNSGCFLLIDITKLYYRPYYRNGRSYYRMKTFADALMDLVLYIVETHLLGNHSAKTNWVWGTVQKLVYMYFINLGEISGGIIRSSSFNASLCGRHFFISDSRCVCSLIACLPLVTTRVLTNANPLVFVLKSNLRRLLQFLFHCFDAHFDSTIGYPNSVFDARICSACQHNQHSIRGVAFCREVI